MNLAEKKRKIQSEYTVISFIYQARCSPADLRRGCGTSQILIYI